MCHSGFNQKNRTHRRYIARDLLQGLGLGDCGGYLGESQIGRAGFQEGQAARPGYRLKLLFRNFFYWEVLAMLFRPSN